MDGSSLTDAQPLQNMSHIFISVNNVDAYDDRLSRQRMLQSIRARKCLSHLF